MLSNRAAFAALALACVAAAGGGGYLATRQRSMPIAPAAVTAGSAQASPAQAVQETEATVGEPVEHALPSPAAPVEPAPKTAAPPSTKRLGPARPPARERAATPPVAAHNRQPPALERTWPTSAASGGVLSSTAAPPVDTPAPVAVVEERASTEPSRPADPPEKALEEVVVPAESVMGLQIESALSSERARVEDRVAAHVVRDVRAHGEVAIPAGSRALGSVMLVERGGRFKERARLGIRFHTLVLSDGTRVPMTTETIYRYGDAPGNGSTAKIGGGAVAGAILGAILGGAKGAAVGATTGAGAGTAVVAAGDRSAAEFPAGTEVTARILSPVTVTIEK